VLSFEGDAGTDEVIAGAAGGVVSMVKLRTAGVGSTFSVRSIARTRRVWLVPSPNGPSVRGVSHLTHSVAASSRHSNGIFGSTGSFDANVYVGVVSLVGPDGPDRNLVLGGWSRSYAPMSQALPCGRKKAR
jgi:hypothetical protein